FLASHPVHPVILSKLCSPLPDRHPVSGTITPDPPTREAPMTPLQSLVAAGTKLWLDSVDPVEIAANRANGATGATSNPIIIADLLATRRFDSDIQQLLNAG